MTGAHDGSIFTRIDDNPILTAHDVPYPVQHDLQPWRGADRRRDRPARAGRGPARASRTCTSRAAPTACPGWTFDAEPLLVRTSTPPRGDLGLRGPAPDWLPELEEWAIAYTAYSGRGPLVSLATTQDFRTVEPPRARHAARGQGRSAVPAPVRRSLGDDPSPFAARMASPTCGSRTRPTCATGATTRCCSQARHGAWWDAGKIGLGPPPLETRRGLAGHVPRRPPHRRRADLPGRPGAAGPRRPEQGPAPHATSGSSDRSAPYELTGDVSRGRVPVRLGPRRGDRPPAHLLRRRRLRDRRRDGVVQRGPRPRLRGTRSRARSTGTADPPRPDPRPPALIGPRYEPAPLPDFRYDRLANVIASFEASDAVSASAASVMKRGMSARARAGTWMGPRDTGYGPPDGQLGIPDVSETRSAPLPAQIPHACSILSLSTTRG